MKLLIFSPKYTMACQVPMTLLSLVSLPGMTSLILAPHSSLTGENLFILQSSVSLKVWLEKALALPPKLPQINTVLAM